MSAREPKSFEPLRILGELERQRVAYVLIGALAGVLHGTDEITGCVVICPQVKPENLERLNRALIALEAHAPEGKTLGVDPERVVQEAGTRLMSPSGEIEVVPGPTGTRGYDDLRRAASREALGLGVRVSVASINDLARIVGAGGREADTARLADLRLLAEIEAARGIAR